MQPEKRTIDGISLTRRRFLVKAGIASAGLASLVTVGPAILASSSKRAYADSDDDESGRDTDADTGDTGDTDDTSTNDCAVEGEGTVTAAIVATDPDPLTEATLDGATLTVDISGGVFDGTLVPADFSLNGAPAGTTIAAASGVDADSALLTLAFDGTDFDADAALGVTVEQSALTVGTGPATTGTVPVTAAIEGTVTATIVATNPIALTEATLNAATLTVDISGGTFNVAPVPADFSLNGAPAGTTILSVTPVDADTVTLTLDFDATDFDADAALSVTVQQSALATGVGPATTGTVPVTASAEGTTTAAIAVTNPSPLTEANLHLAELTVEIADGTYAGDLAFSDFSLATAPVGTSVTGVVRLSDTQVILTLAFDGTDFDVDATLSVTVETGALTGTGPATTSTIPVTAVVE